MSSNNTQDLSEFGYSELSEAAKLLTAYCDGNKSDFLEDGIHIEFNPNSDSVFLVDGDYNVGMMNGNDLEQWLNCPECGTEGFLEDMLRDGQDCCHTFLMESGLAEENEILESKVQIGETSSGSTLLKDIVEGVADLLTEELTDEWAMYDEDDEDDAAAMQGIFEEICDHLNEIAPEGVHFGTQEGDGACYGFWEDEPEED